MPISNESYMNALLSKMYQSMAPVNREDPNADLPIVRYTKPGIPISSTDLDFGYLSRSLESEERAYRFGAISDAVPAMTKEHWYSTGKMISDVYEQVLRNKQLPIVNLTSEEKELFEKAFNYLNTEIDRADPFTGVVEKTFSNSPVYSKYLDLKAQLAAKQMERRVSYYQAMVSPADEASQLEHRIKGPYIESQIDAIKRNIVSSNGEFVEKALTIIADLGGKGPTWYWQKLLDQFEKAIRQTADGQQFRFTDFFPAKFWDAAHDDSWVNFNFGHDEVSTIDTRSSESWGGGVSGSFGLWSFGGGSSRASVRNEYTADTENTSVSLEAIMVPLRRSWFDPSVFWSQAWRFHPDMSNDVISDGSGGGIMPAYPTALLVARNVQIKTGNTHSHDAYAYDKITSSASVGWGPFSIKGNYTKETTTTTHDFVENQEGILCPGMQIFGVVCQKVPKSPDADPSLNWPQPE